MEDIPAWIIKVVEMEKLECRACKREFSIDDLMSIGIQESSKPPHKDTLCIGLFCSKCKELIIFELKEMNLINFAFDILEQERGDNIKRNRPKRKSSLFSKDKDVENYRKKNPIKSKITLKEVRESKKFLKNCKTHEEFMLALGMSLEEIKKYSYKKQKPKE